MRREPGEPALDAKRNKFQLRPMGGSGERELTLSGEHHPVDRDAPSKLTKVRESEERIGKDQSQAWDRALQDRRRRHGDDGG